jgi:Rieske Fe-S protein
MDNDRRGWLSGLLGGGLAASLASFLYPVLRYVSPPEVAEAPVNEVIAGKTGDLATNSGKIVRFGSRPVLLVRTSESEWRAFDGTCTHLNCTVSGPPPRALAQYEVHVRGDEVVISKNG